MLIVGLVIGYLWGRIDGWKKYNKETHKRLLEYKRYLMEVEDRSYVDNRHTRT
jgi:hypothetical protein